MSGNPPEFAVYHCYSDGSGKPEMIYIGSDKAAAFDALISYGRNKFFTSYEIEVSFATDLQIKSV